MTLTALTRVRLTAEARSRFPDIGVLDGVVLSVDDWAVVKWRGLDGESRIPVADLESIA